MKSSKESFSNSSWLYANFFLLSEKLSDIKCYKWKLEILLGKKKVRDIVKQLLRISLVREDGEIILGENF